MLPEEGGYYRWVHRAFGPRWAFQNGWLTWLYSLVDMAIYPVLFTQYLAWFAPGLSPTALWAVRLAVIWGATLDQPARRLARRPLLHVGRRLRARGLPRGRRPPARPRPPHATHVPWRPFLKPGESPFAGARRRRSRSRMWNYFGWDNASTVARRGRRRGARLPARARRSPCRSSRSATSCRSLPTLAASDWTRWREGGWPAIAATHRRRRRPALASALAAARHGERARAVQRAAPRLQPRAAARWRRDGLLPTAIARTDARGTPRARRRSRRPRATRSSPCCRSRSSSSPTRCSMRWRCSSSSARCVVLRRREPELRGPFRIPLGTGGVIALAATPADGLPRRDGLLAPRRRVTAPRRCSARSAPRRRGRWLYRFAARGAATAREPAAA